MFKLTIRRNVSEALSIEGKQTNQRAELYAIKRALDIVPINRDALIYSDSNYAIKCVTEWFINWRKNGWKTSSGKVVDNKDIIEPILDRINERKLARANTNFTWLKGHANDPGNVAADSLAVNGAREAQYKMAIEGTFS
jgi:ribonuclease HI